MIDIQKDWVVFDAPVLTNEAIVGAAIEQGVGDGNRIRSSVALGKAFGDLEATGLVQDTGVFEPRTRIVGFAEWNIDDIRHLSAVTIGAHSFGPHGPEAAVGAFTHGL